VRRKQVNTLGFVLSEKAGVAVVGIKTGLIMPTDDIVEVTMDAVEDTLDDGDIVCVTEAVVARSQNRYITCDELAEDVRAKFGMKSDGTVAVISPIVSRNRFALVLQAIARAVNKGRVVVQLTVPRDEVGNQVIDEEFANNRLRFKKVLRSLQEVRGNTPQMNVLIREIIAALKFQELGYSVMAIRKITGTGIADITLLDKDGRKVIAEVTFENLSSAARKAIGIGKDDNADIAMAVAVDLQAQEIAMVEATPFLAGKAQPETYKYDERQAFYEASDVITVAEIGERLFPHPITGIDYGRMYARTIESEGAQAEIVFTNNPLAVFNFGHIDGIIIGAVHERESLKNLFLSFGTKTPMLTIQDIGPEPWGVIGSNVSDIDKGILKLLPDNADDVCDSIKDSAREKTGKDIEVLIFGDGAYKDPDTGIYELADPYPSIGCSRGLRSASLRQGTKLKLLVETMFREGHSREEIYKALEQQEPSRETLGTTPRNITGILATMADLAAGSADAGTPVVLIRNFPFKPAQ
jgi:F420-0:gamma-glutamyl ligase